MNWCTSDNYGSNSLQGARSSLETRESQWTKLGVPNGLPLHCYIIFGVNCFAKMSEKLIDWLAHPCSLCRILAITSCLESSANFTDIPFILSLQCSPLGEAFVNTQYENGKSALKCGSQASVWVWKTREYSCPPGYPFDSGLNSTLLLALKALNKMRSRAP